MNYEIILLKIVAECFYVKQKENFFKALADLHYFSIIKLSCLPVFPSSAL
jgi:hypothetical protein